MPCFCEKVLLWSYTKGIYYLGVEPDDVPEIVEETILKGRLVDRLLYTDPKTGERQHWKAIFHFISIR